MRRSGALLLCSLSVIASVAAAAAGGSGLRPLTGAQVLPFAFPVQSGQSPMTHGLNKWSGQWKTNTGGVGFRWVTNGEGWAAMVAQGGKPCATPTTYYRGGYYDPGSGKSGKVTGCTLGEPLHLVGRYVADGPGGAGGDIDIKFVAPNTFVGTYTPDATKKKNTGGTHHPTRARSRPTSSATAAARRCGSASTSGRARALTCTARPRCS